MSAPRVAIAADGAHVPAAAVALRSALRHAGPGAEAHFLHGPDLGARARARFERIAGEAGAALALHHIADARLAGVPHAPPFSPAAWYGLFLPELVPDAARILLLDADTLVLDDLRPLWETALEGSTIAAVTNVLQPDHEFHARRLGVEPERYFNSGVLLVDLAAMRRSGAAEEVLAYARAHPDGVPWVDQDALNVVLGDARLPLHPRWNCMNALFSFEHAGAVLGAAEVAEARTRPAIRHFEGPGANKPWRLRSRVPHRRLWRAERRAAWRRLRA